MARGNIRERPGTLTGTGFCLENWRIDFAKTSEIGTDQMVVIHPQEFVSAEKGEDTRKT
jgi:hypothetical protein